MWDILLSLSSAHFSGCCGKKGDGMTWCWAQTGRRDEWSANGKRKKNERRAFFSMPNRLKKGIEHEGRMGEKFSSLTPFFDRNGMKDFFDIFFLKFLCSKKAAFLHNVPILNKPRRPLQKLSFALERKDVCTLLSPPFPTISARFRKLNKVRGRRGPTMYYDALTLPKNPPFSAFFAPLALRGFCDVTSNLDCPLFSFLFPSFLLNSAANKPLSQAIGLTPPPALGSWAALTVVFQLFPGWPLVVSRAVPTYHTRLAIQKYSKNLTFLLSYVFP